MRPGLLGTSIQTLAEEPQRNFAPAAGTPAHHREAPDWPEYPCAWGVEPHDRHKKKFQHLREKIETEAAKFGAFWFDRKRVVFVSPFFCVVRSGAGIDVLWYLDEHDNVVMHGIDPVVGLTVAADGGIEISPTRKVKPLAGDREAWADCVTCYQRMRSMPTGQGES